MSKKKMDDLDPYLRGEKQLADGTEEPYVEWSRHGIDHLSPRYRRFLELDMIEEMSPSQIEIAMGLKQGSFKTFKREAMTALREILRNAE